MAPASSTTRQWNAPAPATTTRWRAFADTVALALGVNVWVALVLLPGIFVGAWSTPSHLMVGLAPLPILFFGIWRRSEVVLLLGFPTSLLLPVSVSREMFAVHVYGIIHFAIVAVGLVAFLFGASVFTSFHEPAPPHSTRMLSSAQEQTPERWRRRFRVYNGLAILSVVFPAVLLYSINFDASTRAFLLEMYPGRVAAFTTFMNLAALAVWLLVYLAYFLGVLRHHRTGDRELLGKLARIRANARRPRPRAVFYVAVISALALMTLLLSMR